jgi:hypothetical protein
MDACLLDGHPTRQPHHRICQCEDRRDGGHAEAATHGAVEQEPGSGRQGLQVKNEGGECLVIDTDSELTWVSRPTGRKSRR